MSHSYGDDWFDCPSCGGSFEHFNQVQHPGTGYCEGCFALFVGHQIARTMAALDMRVEAVRIETEDDR